MHTFKTHDVEIETLDYPTTTARQKWEKRFSSYDWRTRETTQMAKIWNCSEATLLQHGGNTLVDAVGLAYNRHVPLSLSPDAIWTVICHGFSVWINENAEAVRHKFVQHSGKEKLVVDVPPSEVRDPNWNRILGEFSDLIADHIGHQRDNFVNDFSTTTTDARIGSEALLMYSMSQYFDYGMSTMCGFPRLTLEGTPEDWEKIVSRVRNFREYTLGQDDHLAAWTERLVPVVEEFARAANGNPDIDFWRSLYKEGGGSGGPYISGKIVSLYPYLKGRNDVLEANDWRYADNEAGGMSGLTTGRFPRAYTPVDVEWNIYGNIKDMVFQGGVVGVGYSDGVVRPEVGWCVSEKLVTPEENE